jgi:hypothetical protein
VTEDEQEEEASLRQGRGRGIGETNSSMRRWKTSKKGSLALRSVLGGRGDGWRTLKAMGWHAKHVVV